MIRSTNARIARARMIPVAAAALAVAIGFAGCASTGIVFADGPLQVRIEAGDEWNHPFPVFGPFTMPNPPTFAVWITDADGRFIRTVCVTQKMGKASWVANDVSTPEALPTWCQARPGGQPTARNPVADAVTAATPGASSVFRFGNEDLPERVLVWLEINHSVDYNRAWPEGVSSTPARGYSGGAGGSGQPALVYRADVDLTATGSETPLELVGHSESGGRGNGTIYPDLTTLTTALEIVRSAVVSVE